MLIQKLTLAMFLIDCASAVLIYKMHVRAQLRKEKI
jgi:hypothetical protein